MDRKGQPRSRWTASLCCRASHRRPWHWILSRTYPTTECRLYQYASLHCAKSSGVYQLIHNPIVGWKTEVFSNRDIREAIKELKKKGISPAESLPEALYKRFYVHTSAYVKENHEISRNVARLEAITGISAAELWENREDFGFAYWKRG